jgi:transposase-like protein
MVRAHPSTPAERAQWTALIFAHQGEYGIVTRLSRDVGVSCPTLYAWRQQAHAALLHVFTPLAPQPGVSSIQARQILTAWIIHASTRGVQLAMRKLAAQGLSLPTISAVLAEAERRALTWMQTHTPATARVLAMTKSMPTTAAAPI